MLTLSNDILFLHPPSFTGYRKEPWFPGPISRTVSMQSPLFIMIPVGVVSIAQYLIDNGFTTKIHNLGEYLLASSNFNIENYLKNIDAEIFAIDLHWAVHSYGAIKIAEICKKHHPNSFILLGGLTASYFHKEILSLFPFVDGIIRGEAEKATQILTETILKEKKLKKVPNLTYRKTSNTIVVNSPIQVEDNIDQYNFTNLSLIEPTEKLLNIDVGSKRLKVWNIPVSRGCSLNCVTCGGSEYSYEKILNRKNPSFRSPKRLLEDFLHLDEQRVNSIFLFQDCQLAGKSYYQDLFKMIHREKWSSIEHVTLELFYPATNDFLQVLATHKPAERVSLTISPESGSDNVRRAHGRDYTNESIFKSLKKCVTFSIPIGFFFMLSLGYESQLSLKEMWLLWEKIFKQKRRNGFFTSINFGPMLILDPGSIAFENPGKHGYTITASTFKQLHQKLTSPSWVDWINYETYYMKKKDLMNSIFMTTEKLNDLYEKFGIYDSTMIHNEKIRLKMERLIIKEVQDALKIHNKDVRMQRLKELNEIYHDPLLSYSYVITSQEA